MGGIDHGGNGALIGFLKLQQLVCPNQRPDSIEIANVLGSI